MGSTGSKGERKKIVVADILAASTSTMDSPSSSSAAQTVEALICGGDWMRKVHGIKKKKVEDEIREVEITLPEC
ncbi:uncharacterized protein A4U43_C03F1040 [Asparagus officinalis]|uniref:HAT C-terminal dimerisation domain-containing protein n=1 Tax=Asparagus officinalis TaxID=4686 RepID=A0A5P1FBL7_ASPOF|nr:uncharacterized protein A4U43_C03F1040 [Asparagus officinalis]